MTFAMNPGPVRVPSVNRSGADRRPSWIFWALIALFLGLCAAAWFMPLTPSDLRETPMALRAIGIAIVLVGTLITVTLHEWAHATVAFAGGDYSVEQKGYLNLDIRRYSDPMLSIGFPLLFLALGGLPLPGGAVWLNPGALRSKGWRTAVAVAGSSMNLLAGVGLSVLVGTGVLAGHPVLAGSLAYLALIQFAVALLNLLPIPGLDGYSALEPWLPQGIRDALKVVRPYGLFVLILLMLLGAFGFLWTFAFAATGLFGVPRDLVLVGSILARFR